MGIIYPELSDSFGAVCIKNTGPDIDIATAVMTASIIITPSNNKATFFKANHRRIILITRNLGHIYEKLGAGGIAINVETLSPDIIAGAAMAATIIVTPGSNKAAIT